MPISRDFLETQPWRTRDELRLRIVRWIVRTYHRRRKQKTLGKLTLIAKEKKPLTQALTLTACTRNRVTIAASAPLVDVE